MTYESMRQELEAIVAEAARSTTVPVAFISFIDPAGEPVGAVRGWNVTRIPPAAAFAARIAAEKDVVVVPDTTRDPRFASHPLVTGQPNLRFYAGAPIVEGGQVVGALSLVDRTPRHLAADQVTALRLLAQQASREIAHRRQLAEVEERFREFFELTDDLVLSISPRGYLVHFNETLPNTLGISREDLLSRPLESVVEERHREEFRATLEEVFATGEPRVLETVFVTSDGRRITVEGSLRPRVLDGAAVMVRVIFRDISDRKEFELELGNARDAALDAARLKSQFLTNVSHEIRTPMNGVVGMIDLLNSTELTEEQRDYATEAKASADHLLAIVNNILYVSNVESTGLGAANVDFDLVRTLERIVEVMKVAALGKEVDVRFEYQQDLPGVLRGQQSKIRQVVTNLLENAIKFTEEGTVSLRVGLQTETETHRVLRFEVRDTGIGIAPEDRLLLFEKFSQVEGGSRRRYQGTGLGLATARHLVETLGGLIDVESEPGQGSLFWFTIPFPKQMQGRNPIGSSDLDLKGKRVLLIDHQPASEKIVRHYLENVWEMRVERAATAAEALALLRRESGGDPIRVVLYDRLPDEDVLRFSREVRIDKRLQNTSLVLLLAPGEEVNRSAFRDAGIAACLTKPAGQGELFDALAVALAQDAIPLVKAAAPVTPRRPAPVVSPERRKNVRVLLVEDNFLNAKLTMQQLQKLGYEADAVSNGQEAVAALDLREYQIVLMDCQMPVVDGYEATMEIRRLERERKREPRRIIAMTANALEGDREKCLAAGMDDYLSKPTRADDLDAALARFFERETVNV